MKKNIFIAFLSLFTLLSFSQKKEDIYKKIANSCCERLNEKKSSKLTELDLGFAILQVLGDLNEKEKNIIGFNSSKAEESLEKIGEPIGIQMAMACPSIFASLVDENGKNLLEESSNGNSLRGTIEELVSNDFKKIKLKNDKGEIIEFLWLSAFSTDSILVNNKVVKGDKVEINFNEENFFDPKSNSYKKYNVIKGIKFL